MKEADGGCARDGCALGVAMIFGIFRQFSVIKKRQLATKDQTGSGLNCGFPAAVHANAQSRSIKVNQAYSSLAGGDFLPQKNSKNTKDGVNCEIRSIRKPDGVWTPLRSPGHADKRMPEVCDWTRLRPGRALSVSDGGIRTFQCFPVFSSVEFFCQWRRGVLYCRLLPFSGLKKKQSEMGLMKRALFVWEKGGGGQLAAAEIFIIMVAIFLGWWRNWADLFISYFYRSVQVGGAGGSCWSET